jgi:hypothetical protein
VNTQKRLSIFQKITFSKAENKKKKSKKNKKKLMLNSDVSDQVAGKKSTQLLL